MNILTQKTTMTSLQIAELCQKRHDNVKRTIDNLHHKGVIGLPQIEGVRNHQEQLVMTYVFSGEQGRLDSIVVVAQLSPEFTGALVHRWDELEKKSALPDFTNPALAARAWADEYQAKQIAQEQIERDAPKVNFYDTVAASSSLMTVSDAAKKITMSAQELNKKLIAIGAYDKRRLPKKVFSHEFITKGYGVMKLTVDGYDRNLLTQSGQIYVIGLFSRSKELEVV